jgi:hypothetical protein
LDNWVENRRYCEEQFLFTPPRIRTDFMKVSCPTLRRSSLLMLLVYMFSFLFVYAVKPRGVPNISYLGILVIPLAIVVSGQIFSSFKIIIRHKIYWSLILVFYLLLLFSLSVIFIHGTGDLSILKTILHSALSIPACMVIASFLYIDKKHFGIAGLTHFFGFLLKLQILFIIIMLLSSDIRDFIYYLIRSESQAERMAVYHGARGLGVSGSVAFGLATHLAVNYFFYFFLRYTNNKGRFSSGDYFWMFFGAIALLSAGRTAILGIALLPFAVAMYNIQFRRFKPFSFLVKFGSFISFATVVLFFLASFLGDSIAFERYVFYVMQPISLYP